MVIGIKQIDDFWWEGLKGSESGMFPVTHVMELEVSGLLRDRSRSVNATETLFAQALVAAHAQLDEELGFEVGDIITVTGIVDEDWYIGECRGKSGIFLAACVQLLNEDECNESGPRVKQQEPVAETSSKPSSIHAPSQSSVGSSTGNPSVNTNPSVNSPVSNESSNFTVESNKYTSENTKAHNGSDSGVTPYARTLYPFNGENLDELSFQAHDIVTLIQHVDRDWIEGEIDGNIGLFPSNFVEIVVDCPYSYDREAIEEAEVCDTEINTAEDSEQPCTSHDRKPASPADIVESADDEQYALVQYSFTAETDNDLSVTEGETVTVIQQVDDNWLHVRNDSGQTGMCPTPFLHIIGATPTQLNQTHDSNDNEIKSTSESSSNNRDRDTKPPEHVKEAKESVNATKVTQTSHTGPSTSSDRRMNTFDTKTSKVKSVDTVKLPQFHVEPATKPQLRPKPALAPKPALKPKPSLSPKPSLNQHSIVNKRHSVIGSSIPKSSSSNALSNYISNSDVNTQLNSITKAQSMFEMNETQLDTSLETPESETVNTLSVTPSEVRRKSTDSDHKVFENWDLSKPLDSLLKDEFTKAKQDSHLQSGTNRHSNVPNISQNTTKSVNDNSPVNRRHSSYVGNYSRDNFESKLSNGLAVGNSTFFVNNENETPRRKHVRKPPPPPLKRESAVDSFTRKPSYKKPAPPRPMGPRLAPTPSQTPLVPERSGPLNVEVPPRPPVQYSRPAPQRPKTRPEISNSDNLMAFSPSNTSLSKFLCFLRLFVT